MPASADEVLSFIVNELLLLRPDFDTFSLNTSTDLVSAGVESIVILQILASVENNLAIPLTLDNLEKCGFKISADTIVGDLCAKS